VPAYYPDITDDVYRFVAINVKQECTGTVSGAHGRVSLFWCFIRYRGDSIGRAIRLPDTT
jgi:hypothetical protein